MTVLILDETLKPVAPRKPWRDENPHRDIVRRCLSNKAVSRDWKTGITTEREIVFATSVPKDAALYHYSYLGYLQGTYARHDKIVLAPHHFWYTVLCEIAQAVVSDDKLHRPLFTRDPSGKIDIVVSCAREDDPLRMDALLAEMVAFLPVDPDRFMPSFTTSTDASRLACLAAFLETCSPYYNYMMLACGHPAIRLEGTPNDWSRIESNLSYLQEEFAKVGSPVANWLRDNILPVSRKLIESVNGKNVNWFRSIYADRKCGSGSQRFIDGWFSSLFLSPIEGNPELTSFPTHISKVPYTTLPSGTKWDMAFALTHSNVDTDGFMRPDFGWVQIKHLAEPRVTKH